MPSNLPFVLLVEDDPASAELYSQTLSQEYTVLVCDNEEQVIKLIREEEIHAVILEPALMGGRGWALISSIQKELATRPVPIIICSTLDDRKRGMDLGATTFLVKPVLPLTLLGVLRQVTQSA